MFGVIVDSRGGTPGKRVLEGLCDKVCVLIFSPQNRVRSMFFGFYRHIPDKRISEGLF